MKRRKEEDQCLVLRPHLSYPMPLVPVVPVVPVVLVVPFVLFVPLVPVYNSRFWSIIHGFRATRASFFYATRATRATRASL
jgi:hypothetical protein